MMINAYVTARSFGLRYALGLIGWIIVLVDSAAAFCCPRAWASRSIRSLIW